MPANINVTTAFLTGVITFSLFYGAYFVLFLGSLYVLLYRKAASRANYIILGGTVLQFVLITIWLTLIAYVELCRAFITNGGTPDGSLLFLTRLDDWRELSSTALWAVTAALGDIMYIYRLYVVWDRRLRPCLVPLTLLMGSLATTIGLISALDNPVTTVYATEISRWVYAFLSFNLVQNILVNVLIIVRIWRINAQSAPLRVGANFWPVIAVLMESGALYSSSMLVTLLTYVCKNNAAMIMTDMVLPIMGIACNIIIVRVGLDSSSHESTSKEDTNSAIVFTHPRNSIAYPLSSLKEVAESLPENDKTGNVLDQHDFGDA